MQGAASGGCRSEGGFLGKLPASTVPAGVSLRLSNAGSLAIKASSSDNTSRRNAKERKKEKRKEEHKKNENTDPK